MKDLYVLEFNFDDKRKDTPFRWHRQTLHESLIIALTNCMEQLKSGEKTKDCWMIVGIFQSVEDVLVFKNNLLKELNIKEVGIGV